jgi:hypothetical protein
MSEMTATVTKTAKGSINVKGYEQLDYNFHYVTDVFDVKHQKLAECYERWQRVLIIIDTSEFPIPPISHTAIKWFPFYPIILCKLPILHPDPFLVCSS